MQDQETPPDQWPDAVAATIGRRVAHYRRRRGLTAAQLSAALLPLGVNLKRSVIANLESGVRRTVSAAEVLALAYVLGVAPLALLVPVGEADKFEVLPGVNVEPWDAARWITGEGPPPTPPDPPDELTRLWRANVDLLRLYRQHKDAVSEWETQEIPVAKLRVDEASGSLREDETDRALREQRSRRRREIEDSLRLIRRAIRDRGDLPPVLPPELTHLDKED